MTGADKTADPRALYARLRRARGHAPLYALCTGVYALALFLIFSSVGVLLRSVLLLAQGRPGGEPGRLALYLGLISAFAVLAGFTGLGFAWLEQRTQNALRRRMLHSLLHAREDAAAALPAGDLLARFTTDLSEAVDLVGFYLAGWIWAPILSGALSLAWLLAVDWVVAALCAGCALGNYAVMRGFSGRLQALSGQITAGQAAVTQLVDEGIRGRQEVRSYRLGPMLQRRLDAALTALAGAVNRRTALLARRRSLNSLFGGVGVYLAVLLGGAALAGAGRVNFADVIVALPLSDQISQMFTALGHLGPMLAQRTPQAARVFAVIDLPGEEDGRAAAPAPGAGEPERPQPAGGAGADAVVFSHVTFTYPGADAPALRDVSFAIPAGCKTALLGESGSGKSTILRLIQGLYLPDSGQITLNGQRLGAVPPGRWRAGLAVMPQDTVLFQRTIGQNIALADTPDPARLHAAAREADAAGFLEAAPGGYEAVPTQGSGGYSGGQLQRIALARALYRGAPVLLLDEPTSALDAGSEAAVADAIRALPRRYTVVAVTHRPALAEGFDRVLRVENGQVIPG